MPTIQLVSDSFKFQKLIIEYEKVCKVYSSKWLLWENPTYNSFHYFPGPQALATNCRQTVHKSNLGEVYPLQTEKTNELLVNQNLKTPESSKLDNNITHAGPLLSDHNATIQLNSRPSNALNKSNLTNQGKEDNEQETKSLRKGKF